MQLINRFCKIQHHPNHLLAPLLPNEAHTPYHLRCSRHNRQLFPKINKLYDSNFIQRMMYKDLYWLTILYLCIVLYFILLLSCWSVFCQLIINEYCIVLHWVSRLVGMQLCVIWSWRGVVYLVESGPFIVVQFTINSRPLQQLASWLRHQCSLCSWSHYWHYCTKC